MGWVRALLVLVLLVLSLDAGGATRARADDRSTRAKQTEPKLDDEFARKVYSAGKSAFEIGAYGEALQHFQQAYEISREPRLLFNIGEAADHLHHNQTALKAYAMYLELVPKAPNTAEVAERLIALQELIADERDAEAIAAAEERDAARAAALAPAEVALAAPTTATDSADPNDQAPTDEAGKPVWKRWWFWAGAGAVVAIVIVSVAVAAGGDAEPTTGDEFAGSNGMVTQTLVRSGR